MAARTSSRNGVPPEAHTARKAQIAASAAALFVAEGVGSVSMDDIAREVGLAKATVYHYFRTKDDILYQIHEQTFSIIESAAEERYAAGLSPFDQLRGVFRDGFRIVHDHPGYSRVVFEHMRLLPPPLRRKVRANQQRYEARIRGILDAGVADRSFEIDDIHLAMLAFHGMVNWSHQWYSPSGDHGPDEIADYFFKLFVRGVGTTKTRQRLA